jgi:hypothetical protein
MVALACPASTGARAAIPGQRRSGGDSGRFLAIGITLAGALAFGRRLWSVYLLIASCVAPVLLLAPDAYAAFGLIFFVLVAGLVVAGVYSRLGVVAGHSRSPVAAARI